ncbi:MULTISPECIES: DUF4232 domain-containing protein [Streptomyces]|uniref:DUF4232 domain-containing protein n=1 Tax=Streptomyces TaxID=1883 RepID=UPI00034E6805|nr:MULTISPECIES: DUF4232 domain-containing protein [Streptomyces]EPD90816.1 hypothetical protein HMPREF1486_05527 [Streptomyces sp. HPH0547]KPC93141.1 hypothetical protein ADL27_20940 [Streptomyces sp. NRRL F-6602]
MRAKKMTLAALALAAGLSLTACQGNDDSAAGSNSSAASSSGGGSSSSSAGTSGGGSSEESGTSTGGGSGTGGTGGSGTGGTKAAGSTEAAPGSGGGKITTGDCKTENLEFSSSHGMGEGDLIVTLKNVGGDACSLKGFPGVDLRSQDAGRPLSAKRSDLAAPAVSLQNGEETRFTLHYPPNNTGGTGAYVSSMVVTPPNETHSKSLPVSISLPVEVGADQKVVVDPVGTGKQ